MNISTMLTETIIFYNNNNTNLLYDIKQRRQLRVMGVKNKTKKAENLIYLGT